MGYKRQNEKIDSVQKTLHFDAVFQVIPDLFFLMEKDGTILDFKAGDDSKLYLPPKSFLGARMQDVLPKNVGEKFSHFMMQACCRGEMQSFEYELEVQDGLRQFEARLSCLAACTQVIAMVRDITIRKDQQNLILHQAHFDTLTGLPNRFLALDRLSQLLNEVSRHKTAFAVLFLDLDDFKKINDSMGHETGDKLLVEAAERLNKVLRATDTVGRLGGDEFIVLLPCLADENDVLAVVDAILHQFRASFKVGSREMLMTVSIGVAIYPENGNDSSQLLRNADAAMYHAKALGRNTYSFFTQSMNQALARRLELEEQIQGALERSEFEVYYQPQINIRTGEVVGAEALLRWKNEGLGSVPPDEFIPIAEHTGLIVSIGLFVLRESLETLTQWQKLKGRNLRMSVNLSPCQFRDPDLVEDIKFIIKKYNIDAECLDLEITEGVLMSGHDYIDEALKELTRIGVCISMDDFGTGYSSLSYLRRYPFDVLKIDRSFISDILLDPADRELIVAAISMAHALSIQVVAEGVETLEQLQILSNLSCDYAQGYYISKPAPKADLLAFPEKIEVYITQED